MIQILTVDDSRAVRAIIKKALSFMDVEITQAEDGKQGLDAVEQSKPDLILLDVTMPVMDGAAMLKELRARGHKIPVILLTAESKTSIIGSMMSEGIHDYIVKPFKPEQLQAKVTKVLQKAGKTVQILATPAPEEAAAMSALVPASTQPTPQPHEAQPATPPPGGFVGYVLVVDDMVNVAKKLRELLPANLALESCLEGPAAMNQCRVHKFDLILIDTEIPGTDSTALARQLGALQSTARVVALVMKTKKEAFLTQKNQAFVGVITKPFTEEDLGHLLAESFASASAVTVADDLITVMKLPGADDNPLRYFMRLKELLVQALEKLADGSYERAVLDIRQIPRSPDHILRLLVSAMKTAETLGIKLRLVVTDDLRLVLAGVVETSELPSFDSVEAASA